MRPLFLVAGLVLPLLLLRWAPVPSLALAPVSRTITVDQRGGGQYTTVQAAVDAVPEGNSRWVRIYVKQGIYREKVTIPSQKGFIMLQGDGHWNTEISFDAHAYDMLGIANITDYSSTYTSATFTAQADDFIARSISFKNTYGGFDRPAVAALVGGDRSAFYDCAFRSYQDTLCDFTGRHHFRRCIIEGAVDFIFGFGRSIYEDCTLLSNMPASSRQPGWVTAHAAEPGSYAGLVFKGGRIVGSGRQFLGRPWKTEATVVFFQVTMAGIVVPQGWDKWNSAQDVSRVTYAEVGCRGPGSYTAERVPWEKHLSYREVQRFVDIRFIDDGWLSNQPW
ncbi:probable pectinesterase 66 [Lolium rigidum]|uniref:probable pectinesterase 66 n=1 Tax=Lolium rigidum TaxID=89674 RepID=UPI001F5D7EE4|nr:probable pectinesterase 66 [Lolium rigidum]